MVAAIVTSLCATATVDPVEVGATPGTPTPTEAPSLIGEDRLPEGQMPPPGIRAGGAVDVSGDVVVIGQRSGGSPSGSGGAHVYRRVGGAYRFEASLRNPALQQDAGFGWAVAVDGDTIVVGAPGMDVGGAINAGAAYVFQYAASTWGYKQELVPSSRVNVGEFGKSVDLEGDTALIGQNGSSGTRVFTQTASVWSQQQILSVPGAQIDWSVGASVALSGNTAVVGATGAPSGVSGPGQAFVFVRSGTTWTAQQTLQATVPIAGSRFGGAVAIDGNTVAVGASQTGTGRGYAFTRSGTTWTQQHLFEPVDGGETDNFGGSAGIEGDVVVFGSPGHDGAVANGGAAYAATRSGGTWSALTEFEPTAQAQGGFGLSAALHDDTLVLGAHASSVPYANSGAFETRTWSGSWSSPTLTLPVADEGAGRSVATDAGVVAVGAPDGWTGDGAAGSVAVSVRSSGTWVSGFRLRRPVGASGDRFGASVAMHGSTLAVGTPGGATVEVFERSGQSTGWNHVQTVTAAGQEAGDEFGASIALDGDLLAIGAPGDDDVGTNAGAVFVVRRTAGVWGTPVRTTFFDPPKAGDDLGRSVAVTGDLVIAGAPGNDAAGIGAGAVARFTPDGSGGWHTATAADLLVPGGLLAGDALGTSVAASPAYLVAGAPTADPAGSASGEAWVFTPGGDVLGALAKSDGAANDRFGQSVAADGIQIAVGTPGDDDEGSGSGTVQRYLEGDGSFPILDTLTAPDAGASDDFGRAIALDATAGWLAVGAPGWDGATTGLGAGYAFGFESLPEQQGELRVTTNPAVASTVLIDGKARDQWGLTWLNLDPGTYDVCFTDVPGYVTPPCESATVIPGQTTTVQGNFTQMATLQVVTSPALASTITLQDLTNGGPGYPANKWGVYSRIAPNRNVRVCFGAVAGWNPPPCQDIPASQLEPGEFKQVTGTFTANASAPGPAGKGELRVTTSPAVPATVTIDGVPRDEWGLTWLELDPGTYEVCLSDIPGRRTPVCSDEEVIAGAVAEKSFTSQELGYLRVITQPGEESTIYVNDVPANDWGVWLPVSQTTWRICFGRSRTTGRMTVPLCQTVSSGPAPGQTVTVTGVYP